MSAPLENTTPVAAAVEETTQTVPPLGECVRRAVTAYFRELNGHKAAEVYELVLSEVEPPLLEVVLRETRGNITHAAEMLGLNRATLRKKLKKYGLGKQGTLT